MVVQLLVTFSSLVPNGLVVPNSISMLFLERDNFLMAKKNKITIVPTRVEVKIKINSPASTNRKFSLAEKALCVADVVDGVDSVVEDVIDVTAGLDVVDVTAGLAVVVDVIAGLDLVDVTAGLDLVDVTAG